ncbi:MAG: Re/Si-specific NAD(P)(+) transhydrogenase subunit alpha [Opitutales bacterium]
MKLFVPKETHEDETRVAMTPDSGTKLVGLGLELILESGLGLNSGHPDDAYREIGATIASDADAASREADVVARVRKPTTETIGNLSKGCLHLSFLDPFNEKDLISQLAAANVSAVSLEMIPRTTLAQKMDVLSSQANLAGYQAVILAAERFNRILPMMMTPSGTISPAKFFVIGVGVAGLQAIATAKRLGARVEAFDTRPVVEEQVKSLGAKFVKVDLGETGQTDQGYAKELTPEQMEKQREAMAKACAKADVVITTAKLFGRPAPRIVTKEILDQMAPGSIVVDLAAETGGNVEGVRIDEETVTDNGVRIIGHATLEGMIPRHASQMFAANVTAFLEHFWDDEGKTLNLDLEDEIMQGCLITHDGAVVHDRFKEKD